MQNRFPLWKNILILMILVVGIFYALPNLFGNDPSVQISSSTTTPMGQGKVDGIEASLKSSGIPFKSFEFEKGKVLARFNNTDDQLKAADYLKDKNMRDTTVALNLAPATPGWLRAFNANPMYLGLDLRGGVHFLLEIDMDKAIKDAEERYQNDIKSALRTVKIYYQSISKDNGRIRVKLKTEADKIKTMDILDDDFRKLSVIESENSNELLVTISENAKKEIKKFALDQNMATLRNRVNEIGVAEPIIQQQGTNRIVVQLPGVQDTTRAKEILGTTATLEYHLADVEHDVQKAIGRTDSSRFPFVL